MRENVSRLYDALKAETIDFCRPQLFSMTVPRWRASVPGPETLAAPCRSAGECPLSGRQTIEFSELKGYELVDIDRGSGITAETPGINTTLEDAGLAPKVAYVSRGHRDNCAGHGFGDGICPPTQLLRRSSRKRQGERYPNRGQGTRRCAPSRHGYRLAETMRSMFSRQVPAGGR